MAKFKQRRVDERREEAKAREKFYEQLPIEVKLQRAAVHGTHTKEYQRLKQQMEKENIVA